MPFDALPVELYITIASYLPLRDLIIFRSVSPHLRSTITKNTSSIRPAARRELLRVWDRLIASPYFLPSRPHIIPHLRPFDRAEHLAWLSHAADPPLAQLPAQFETWIREWPAKAAIGWTWPGLSEGPYYQPSYNEYHDGPCAHVWWQLAGGNPLRAEGRAHQPVYPVTRAAAAAAGHDDDGDGDEQQQPFFLWLDWHFPGLAAGQDSSGGGGGDVAATTGFGIPVWTVSPGDQQLWGYGTGHMLIVSGLGPGYDGTVQRFEEGDVEGGGPGRLLLKDALDGDTDQVGEWPYRPWCGRRTELWFRGRTWVDWLERQLEVLEASFDGGR